MDEAAVSPDSAFPIVNKFLEGRQWKQTKDPRKQSPVMFGPVSSVVQETENVGGIDEEKE